MSRYEVQFKSSGIVAFSASERGICAYWMECNDYGPEQAVKDPEDASVRWVKGDCLGLFTLIKVK